MSDGAVSNNLGDKDKKKLGGRYEFNEMLGEGGEGAVYRGFDVRLRIDVAVKQFSTEKGNGETILGKELSLTHPAFPRVTDIICEEDSQYVVMDYIEGRNGAAYVQDCGVLKGAKLREVAVSICNAMKYLHDVKMVLHCDLKPENLIFCNNGDIKLIDVACAEFDNKHSTTELIGTPCYCAPEVCSFRKFSKQSDVFSFGATLYFLATGRNPNLEKFCMPSQLSREVDKVVEGVILRALRPIPAERFQCFDEIISLLSFDYSASGYNSVNSMFRNPVLNFVNNAELAFEYSYVLAKKLNKRVLIGITQKAYEFLDERLVYFDTLKAVSFIQAIESKYEGGGKLSSVVDFAVQPDGMNGVFTVVIPGQNEAKDKAQQYLLETGKEFDCLIFVSMFETIEGADLNIFSLSENLFEAQSAIQSLKMSWGDVQNFRYVVFDGILNFAEVKSYFTDAKSIRDQIIGVIPRSIGRCESRLFGSVVTTQMQNEMEQSYLLLAKQFGLSSQSSVEVAAFHEQDSVGNKVGRHRRNEEAPSLWKYKMGSNQNGRRH